MISICHSNCAVCKSDLVIFYIKISIHQYFPCLNFCGLLLFMIIDYCVEPHYKSIYTQIKELVTVVVTLYFVL